MRQIIPSPFSSLSFEQSFQILKTPVKDIKGIGPKLSEVLYRINIKTVEDLLYCLPRKYIDRRKILKISEIKSPMHATITGNVLSPGKILFAGRKRIFELLVNDGSQTIKAKWFNMGPAYLNFMKNKFKINQKVIMSGFVSEFRFQKEIHHPEIEAASEIDDIGNKLKIIPVYSLTEGLKQKSILKIMEHVISFYSQHIPDFVPVNIQLNNKLDHLHTAIKKVHFPDNNDCLEDFENFTSSSHCRIIFDEFFLFQTILALKKRGVSVESGIQFSIPPDKLSCFFSSLPFSLTVSQKKALEDIFSDMKKPSPMRRLLQGDVGSGKTLVALTACLISIWNGYQSAFMAPTEILAEQHFRTVQDLTEFLGINVALLTGRLTKPEREETLNLISSGRAQIIIGTHSLIQETVKFHNLGIAIVDEQHKFGVMQRAEIKKKGSHPDMLVMTATPIPRTLGLTVYGDLDLTIINELPPGRKPVTTKIFHENQRQTVYTIVQKELIKKNQVFIIYPLVEESEKIDLMDATKMSLHLQHDVFPQYRVGLVHGKMDTREKDAVMREFHSGRIHILVATTVVEVGIDIPNASLIIIEHAERFGLSQLHQLRGRVGRGASDSMCILLAQYKKSCEAIKRLKVIEKTNDGFKIAEEDFNIRGPGEFLGTRQSGIPDFRIAHIGRDINILVQARKAAFSLVENDPGLNQPENQLLKRTLLDRMGGRLELAGIG